MGLQSLLVAMREGTDEEKRGLVLRQVLGMLQGVLTLC